MFKLLILLVALIAVSNGNLIKTSTNRGSRATEGLVPAPGNAAWVVAITAKHSGFFDMRCAGALISDEWIITAAICGDEGPVNFVVQLGEVDFTPTNSIDVPASNFVKHPEYENFYFTNNVGLLRLPSPVTLSGAIAPINLPPQSDNTFVGTTGIYIGTVSDYGIEYSSIVRYNTLDVISNEVCLENFNPSETEFCAIGGANNPEQAPCNMDDGSSFALSENGEFTLIGVSTWARCFDFEPASFTRINLYLGWIASTTGISV